MRYEKGDLLKITRDLVIRKDGFCFNDADVDSEGKLPRQWFDNCDELTEGSLCTYIRDAEDDDEYLIVRKDLVGRPLVLRAAFVECISKFSDAVESNEDEPYDENQFG